MNMPTTLIVTSIPNPKGGEDLQAYVHGVMPLLFAAGGVIVKRNLITDTFLGKAEMNFLLVMNFPSKDRLINMFESESYQELVTFRNKAFSRIDILFADDLP